MAYDPNIIVEVGQTWIGIDGHAYIITSIDENLYCWATDVKNGKKHCRFGGLYSDHTPCEWSQHRSLAEPKPTPTMKYTLIKGRSNQPSIVDFFKKVPDGYCPCNVLKSLCEYHK